MADPVQILLVMEEGPRPGERYPIPSGSTVTIGRDADNTIVINDPRISRHHARLYSAPDGSVLVEDLGSTNGTFVNSTQISGAQVVVPGDEILLADFARLRLVNPEPPVTQPVPWPPPPVPVPPDQPLPPPPALGNEPYVPPATPSYVPPQEAYIPLPSEPARPWPATEPDLGPGVPLPPAPPEEPPAEKRRPIALYVGIGCGALLLLCCLATAVYLWFAPVEFWQEVYSLLGFPG